MDPTRQVTRSGVSGIASRAGSWRSSTSVTRAPVVERFTVTVVVHAPDTPAAFVALHETVVFPSGNSDPDFGEQLTVTGTVPSYEAFAASELMSPAEATLLPQYATTLAARGRAVEWPPQRGAVCWCGSGRGYGECHGE